MQMKTKENNKNTNTKEIDSNKDISTQKEDIEEQLDLTSTLRIVCMIMALMIHALLTGLAVGLQTEIAAFIAIMSVLVFHKCLIGLSLGINIVGAKQKLSTYVKEGVSYKSSFLKTSSKSIIKTLAKYVKRKWQSL